MAPGRFKKTRGIFSSIGNFIKKGIDGVKTVASAVGKYAAPVANAISSVAGKNNPVSGLINKVGNIANGVSNFLNKPAAGGTTPAVATTPT